MRNMNYQINPKLLSRMFTRSLTSAKRDVRKIREFYDINVRLWVTPAEVAEYFKMTIDEVLDAIEEQDKHHTSKK
jgi:hypothetical protein